MREHNSNRLRALNQFLLGDVKMNFSRVRAEVLIGDDNV